MLRELKAMNRRGAALSVRGVSLAALRLAPWVVFGPITGVMSEAAVAAFRGRRPVLGSFWVLLNISILIAIPTLTAAILAHSVGHKV